MQRNGVDYYYHADDLGSIVAVTNSDGTGVERYDYSDFGDPKVLDLNYTPVAGNTSAIGNPYLFTGRRYDPETGYYWYRTRYYDPLAGRFTSRDSIGIWGDPFNLGNGLAYVGNSPGTFIDPFGFGFMSTYNDIITGVALGVGTFVSDTYNGVDAAFSHPIDTAMGVGYATSMTYTNFRNAGYGVIDAASETASATAVTMLGGNKILNVIDGTDARGKKLSLTERVANAVEAIGQILSVALPAAEGLSLARGSNISSECAIISESAEVAEAAASQAVGEAVANGTRGVANLLRSAEDALANPELLRGMTLEEAQLLIGETPGWVPDVMRHSSTHPNGGWVFREADDAGNLTGRMIQYHPGTKRPGHFDGEPYWKVSQPNKPIVKVEAS